jgi:hypothetical protein
MSIVLRPFINKKNTTIFIYNKGSDIPFGIPSNTKNLKNHSLKVTSISRFHTAIIRSLMMR